MKSIFKIQNLKQELKQLLLSDDVEYREMKSNEKQAVLIYVKTLCEAQTIKQFIVKPFWETVSESEFIQYLQSFPECEQAQDLKSVSEKILHGFAVVFIADLVFLLDSKNIKSTDVAQSVGETTVQGPTDSFNEDMLVGLNLVRRRYKKASLRVEFTEVGNASKTNVAIVYDEDTVNTSALSLVKDRLSQVDVETVRAAGQLAKAINDQKYSLVPTIMITERPDRTVRNIEAGKIALMIDTTGFVLILPATFSDFFASLDDEYELRPVGKFLLGIRYIGLVVTLLLPALYVATISFNPEFFRVQLAFSIAASRAAVPYPSYLEVVFMLLMMEFLTEASIRLPKAIGPTATTVGGLILGQAVSEAGLVSNIMIIIVSTAAISNFVIPVSAMSFAIRLLKYPIIVLASFYGMIGVVIGFSLFLTYLCSLESFGTPYVKLFRKVDGS